MDKIYLLEKISKNDNIHDRKVFKNRKELFNYLLANEKYIFNHGFERNQLLITEVEIQNEDES